MMHKLIVASYNFLNAAQFVPNRLAPTLELYRARCVPTPMTWFPEEATKTAEGQSPDGMSSQRAIDVSISPAFLFGSM